MKHNRFPTVVIQRTRTKHFITLSYVFARRFGIAECVRKTHAFNWLLWHAGNVRRWFNTDQLKQSRHHIYRVQILCPHFVFGRKFFGPMHNQRVGYTAFVSFALPSFERCVTCPRPTPRIVIVRVWRAEQINSFHVFFKTLGHEVKEKHFVE